jgi:hypothetical protein
MRVPLCSGLAWEDDPDPNEFSHNGRSLMRDVRAESDPSIRMVAKCPTAEHSDEIYSIGMERVAYTLAELLDLPVLPTHLEEVDGRLSSLHRRVVPALSWKQLSKRTDLRMATNVVNNGKWAAAAMFDVWIANVDRRPVNLLFEPVPTGVEPGQATGSHCWLIDHGHCGLFPGEKFIEGAGNTEFPDLAVCATGRIWDKAEEVIPLLMPAAYRRALSDLEKAPRTKLLDAIRSIGDDSIDNAVDEVPDGYMTAGEREATIAFLKGRRDRLDTVLNTYW